MITSGNAGAARDEAILSAYRPPRGMTFVMGQFLSSLKLLWQKHHSGARAGGYEASRRRLLASWARRGHVLPMRSEPMGSRPWGDVSY